jgi:tetratricopeptide (TPR) repeat protein
MMTVVVPLPMTTPQQTSTTQPPRDNVLPYSDGGAEALALSRLPLPGPVRALDIAIEVVLVALLVFLPAAFGTVDAWSEMVAYAGGGVIAALLAVRMVLVPPRTLVSPAGMTVAFFVALALAQLLRLPPGLVAALSPNTAGDKVELLSDLPDARAALSRMTLSFYPLATRRDLRVVLLAVTVFAAVTTVFRDRNGIRRLLSAVALIGGAVGLLALAQDVSGTRAIYWTRQTDFPARSGPFFNHSHFGQFMNLSLGAALALLLARLHRASPAGPIRPRRAAVVASAGAGATAAHLRSWLALLWPAGVVVLAPATIALSLTRGGIVATLAAGALTLLVLLTRRHSRWMAAVLVSLAVVAGVALTYYGLDRVYDRLSGGIGGSIATRTQILRDVSAMVRRFPLVGTGLGTFEYVYPAYDNNMGYSATSHAENEYAQVTVEMGFLGLAAVLAFVAIIARRYVRAVQSGGGIAVAAIGLGFGLIAVMLHSLSDFGQHLPSVACLSAVTCGLLYNLGASPDPADERSRRDAAAAWRSRSVAVVGAVAVLAIVAWALIHAAGTWQSEEQWRAARRWANRLERRDWAGTPQQFAALLRACDAALAVAPDNAYFHNWTAVYRWRDVAAHQRDPDTGKLTPAGAERAKAVVDQLNRARWLCPTYGEVYTFLGQIERNYLDRPIGITHLQTGFRLARNDATTAFFAGEADARRGRDKEALPKFRHAIALDVPTILDITQLYIDLGRPEQAIAVADGLHWLVMMHAAKTLHDDGRYPDVARRAHARGIELLAEMCHSKPVRPYDWAVLASYRVEQERYEEAEKLYAKAIDMSFEFQPAWRLERAKALVKLGRNAEALEEARLALRYKPDLAEARALIEKLTQAPAP